MKAFSQTLSYILPLLYLGVVYLYYGIFFGKRKSLESKTTPILTALLCAHAVEIATRLLALRAMPLSTVFDGLSFLSFAILFIYILIESSFKNKSSGFFVLLFAFLVKLLSSFSYNWERETNALLSSPTFTIHAFLTLTGCTAIALSALYALMYVIQHRNMKKHRFGVIYRQMPPLDYLERMSIRAVALGVMTLGLGIVLGHVETALVFGSSWISDPKVIITDAIWILYSISYVMARLFRWRGRRMAYLSLSGFLVLMTSGVLVYVVSGTFHKFN